MVLWECFCFFFVRIFLFLFIFLLDNWDVGVLGILLVIVVNWGNVLIGVLFCEDYVRFCFINNLVYNLVGLL